MSENSTVRGQTAMEAAGIEFDSQRLPASAAVGRPKENQRLGDSAQTPGVATNAPHCSDVAVLKRPPEDGAIVYFVQAPNGLIKIGCTNNWPKRSLGLGAGSPVPLTLLAWTPVRRYAKLWIERAIHNALGEYREHNEWFRPEGEVMRFVGLARSGVDLADVQFPGISKILRGNRPIWVPRDSKCRPARVIESTES